MHKDALRWVGVVAAGAIAGAIGSTVVGQLRSENRPIETKRTNTEMVPSARSEEAYAAAGPALAKAMFEAMSAPARTEPAPQPASSVSRADARRAEIDHNAAVHERHLEAHRIERRDTDWAPAMEERIGRVFQTSVDAGAVLESQDCATSTCVLRLAWPSDAEAHAGLRDIMAATMGIRCTRELVLPEDEANGDGPYEASMFVDCGSERIANREAR